MAVKYFAGFSRTRKSRSRATRSKTACVTATPQNPEELIEKIRFLASAGRLADNKRFTEQERTALIAQVERNGGSYRMLYDFSEALKAGKHWEAISEMLRKANSYGNKCDEQIIFDTANSFIRQFGK